MSRSSVARQLEYLKLLRNIIALFMLLAVFSNYAYAKEKPEAGPYKEYYENGVLKEEGNYRQGKKHGLFKEYDDQGELMLEGSYKDGKKEGIFTEYSLGRINWERKYRHGELHGITKKYFEFGSVNGIWHFKKGELLLTKEHYSNGDLLRYWDYGRSKSKGIVIVKEYYHSGKLFSHKIYNNNVLVSLKRYDKKGQITLEQLY